MSIRASRRRSGMPRWGLPLALALLLTGPGAHAAGDGQADSLPAPIVGGGIVLPLYLPGAPHLDGKRRKEPERFTMTEGVPGRVQSVVNIHNPSIEVHPADPSFNTGAAVILLAGGAHRTLNVGTEAADVLPFLYNLGVTGIILRHRLKGDGYDVHEHALRDTLQAIRMVRSRAQVFGLHPERIGVMGFSAGAELAAEAGLFHGDGHKAPPASDLLHGVSARPDFVVLLYPGPTPFSRDANTKLPPHPSPAFVATAGSGDRAHALWALDYVRALVQQGVPNVELHVYGKGEHANGLKDRGGIPFGTWPQRFVDWFRDLGFLERPAPRMAGKVERARKAQAQREEKRAERAARQGERRPQR